MYDVCVLRGMCVLCLLRMRRDTYVRCLLLFMYVLCAVCYVRDICDGDVVYAMRAVCVVCVLCDVCLLCVLCVL